MRETTPFSIAWTPATRLLAAWNARSPMAAGSTDDDYYLGNIAEVKEAP